MRLDVPAFQQRPGECGNTSLKAVCWYHGLRPSARELGRLAGLSSDGIDHAPLVRAAERMGATVEARSGGTVAALRGWLRRGQPPIVGWWLLEPGDADFDPAWTLAERRANDCGHYSVVCGLERRRIVLMDPHLGGLRALPIAGFTRRWYDTDGPSYRRVDRWFMVARFERRRGSPVDA